MTSLGSSFYRDKQVKMKSLGWALIQYNWYPFKEKFGHRDRHLWREDGVKGDEGSTLRNQGTPKIATKPPAAGGEA